MTSPTLTALAAFAVTLALGACDDPTLSGRNLPTRSSLSAGVLLPWTL